MKPLDQCKCLECSLQQCGYVPWQKPAEVQYPILVVGQAPGHTETLTKVPFTGPAGKMFWSLLNKAGIDKSKLYITNVVQCAPPEDREPTKEEIECCRQHLLDELAIVQPKLVIAVGEVALGVLTEQHGIQKKRGEIFPIATKFNSTTNVYCVLHPSFVMRQRQWINIAVQDLQKIPTLIAMPKGIEITKSEPEFIIDPPPSELSQHLAEMSNSITAIDIETPAELDILSARVLGIAFCSNRNKAVTLNFNPERRTSEEEERWQVMKEFLADEKAKKCTQNGQFDLGVLETNEAPVKGLVYDTLLAEHTMNSDLPGNLDFLRSRYTDIPSYKPDKASMKQIATWGKEKRAIYNCWDVITTLAVMEGQKKLMSPLQAKVLYDIEVPLIHVCNYMERKGIKVDINTLALMNKRIQPQIDAFEKTHFDPIMLNPRSPIQIKKLFNIEDTSEEALQTLIKKGHKQSELMKAILEYRALSKISSVYLIGIYERLRDGRIHAHPKITGTGTGRLAYQNPNLQNVPKNMRLIYIPDNEDYVLVEGDYSQLEVRVIANVAHEETMLTEMSQGLQVHHIMGKAIFNKTWDELTDLERLRAKTVVFGTAYGRTPHSIARGFGVTVREAEIWQNLCIKKYPKLLEYIRARSDEFNRTQRCTTAFGRVRFLQSVTQAYNTPIQSAGADVMMTTLIELFKRGFDIRITVHDSVVIQVAKTQLKEVVAELKEVMERPIKELNNYCFPAKIQAGKNWRDITEIDYGREEYGK